VPGQSDWREEQYTHLPDHDKVTTSLPKSVSLMNGSCSNNWPDTTPTRGLPQRALFGAVSVRDRLPAALNGGGQGRGMKRLYGWSAVPKIRLFLRPYVRLLSRHP